MGHGTMFWGETTVTPALTQQNRWLMLIATKAQAKESQTNQLPEEPGNAQVSKPPSDRVSSETAVVEVPNLRIL